MAKPRKKDRLETSPWSGLRRSGASVIEGYSAATARWEKIAEVASSPSIDSGAAADFIMRVMTEHSRQRAIIGELMAALEICLEAQTLPWDAEHDADISLARAKKTLAF